MSDEEREIVQQGLDAAIWYTANPHEAAWVWTERQAMARACRVLGAEVERLWLALIAHRADLHSGSRRPCPTCRQSAEALGILALVPDCCANVRSRGDDAEALKKKAAKAAKEAKS